MYCGYSDFAKYSRYIRLFIPWGRENGSVGTNLIRDSSDPHQPSGYSLSSRALIACNIFCGRGCTSIQTVVASICRWPSTLGYKARAPPSRTGDAVLLHDIGRTCTKYALHYTPPLKHQNSYPRSFTVDTQRNDHGECISRVHPISESLDVSMPRAFHDRK